MKGIVVQFRRSRKVIKEKHYLLDFGATNREEAKKFAGKEVEWKTPSGKIRLYTLNSGLVGNFSASFFRNDAYIFSVDSYKGELVGDILSTFKFIK